jgi:gliding motility-associated-like protein
MSVTAIIHNPTAVGLCDGSIDINVSGGTPDFAYHWSTTPQQTTEDAINLCAGSYTVTIVDNNGCTFVGGPFVVGADISAVITKPLCNGLCTGSINIAEPAFGVAPYTYIWGTNPPQNTQDISNLCAGTYCVTITDNAGSSRDSCFVVGQPNPIVLSATVTNDVNMNCGGAIDLNVTGGTQPPSYLWIGPGTFTATTQDIIGLCQGQYCVTVTDANGCTQSNCYNVSINNALNVSLNAQQHNGFQISCAGICDGVITSTVSGGTPPLTYHWTNNLPSTANQSNVCAGTYGLTVTDANGQTTTASIVMNAPPPLNVNITITDPSFEGASDGAASAIVTGGVPNITYLWTGPGGFTGNTAGINNIPAGSYLLLVTDGNGCQETEVASVGQPPSPCHKGMTVFTPNSDGKNDFFEITCVEVPNHIYIFNRNGGLVYETDNYQNNWIGVDNDDEPVPDGGYLWVLEEYENGSTQLYKGVVILLRTAD